MKKIIFALSLVIPFCIPVVSPAGDFESVYPILVDDPCVRNFFADRDELVCLDESEPQKTYYYYGDGIEVNGISPKQKLKASATADNAKGAMVVSQGMAGLLRFEDMKCDIFDSAHFYRYPAHLLLRLWRECF